MGVSGEKVFEVAYLQAEEQTTLCRFQIGDSGLTVTSTANEEVVLYIKWESVKAWWNAKGTLTVTEKGDSSEAAKDKSHKFKCDQMEELVERMTTSLSSLLKAQQSAILDSERSSLEGARASNAGEDNSNSKLKFKLKDPVEGNLMKQRNKFPKVWQRRFFVLVDEAGYVAIKYFNTREDYLAKQAPLGSVDLRTMDKFTYSGDLIYFEAFQPNKERSKEWLLKGDSSSTKEVLNSWAAVLQEVFTDVTTNS